MKFENYLQKKNAMLETLKNSFQGSKSLNENVQYQNMQPLNENLEKMMELITSAIKYTEAEGQLEKYKELMAKADTELVKYAFFVKTKAIANKITALTQKISQVKDRKQKETLIMTKDKLMDAKDEIESQQEVYQDKMTNALNNFKTDFDKITNAITTTTLKDIITKKVTLATQEIKQEGLQRKAEMAKATTKDPERQSKIKIELDEIQNKMKELQAKFDDAEEAGAEDLESAEGIKKAGIMEPAKAFLAASNKVAVIKNQLFKLKGETGDLGESNINLLDEDEYGYDFLEEDINEKKSGNSATPEEVLSAINGMPNEDEDDAKAKEALYKKLKAQIEPYRNAVKDQLAKKAAIWKMVKGKPTTKEVIALAGGDIETAEEKDGDYIAKTLTKKWGGVEGSADFAEEDEFAPLKAVADMETELENQTKKAEFQGKGYKLAGEDKKETDYADKVKTGDPQNADTEGPKYKIEKITIDGTERILFKEIKYSKGVEVKDDAVEADNSGYEELKTAGWTEYTGDKATAEAEKEDVEGVDVPKFKVKEIKKDGVMVVMTINKSKVKKHEEAGFNKFDGPKADAEAKKKDDGTKLYTKVVEFDDNGKTVVMVKEGIRVNFKNSRIVPTFESFIQKYKNRF